MHQGAGVDSEPLVSALGAGRGTAGLVAAGAGAAAPGGAGIADSHAGYAAANPPLGIFKDTVFPLPATNLTSVAAAAVNSAATASSNAATASQAPAPHFTNWATISLPVPGVRCTPAESNAPGGVMTTITARPLTLRVTARFNMGFLFALLMASRTKLQRVTFATFCTQASVQFSNRCGGSFTRFPGRGTALGSDASTTGACDCRSPSMRPR